MNFSAAAIAQMRGKRVRALPLAEMFFASGTLRMHPGMRTFSSLDGKVWMASKKMGRISTISQSYNGTAPPMQFSLSGVDPSLALKAKADPDEWRNRPIIVYYQFFQLPDANGNGWQPLDNPYPMTMVRMATITTRVEPSKKKGEGRVFTISVNAEGPFATKRRPRFSYYTDRDQKLRVQDPNDDGLERALGIDNKFIKFPVF